MWGSDAQPVAIIAIFSSASQPLLHKGKTSQTQRTRYA